MDTERPEMAPSQSPSQEELALHATAELALVTTRLKQAQKILRRDWAHLTPRARSEQSRNVRELELQEKSLLDEIDTYRLV